MTAYHQPFQGHRTESSALSTIFARSRQLGTGQSGDPEFNAKTVAPVKTGKRKQVSTMEQHQKIEQVLPREESNPGKPIPCAARGDSRGEA
jgi:hypothetical protein